MVKKTHTRRRSRRAKRARKYSGGDTTDRKAEGPNPTDAAPSTATTNSAANSAAPTGSSGGRRKTRKMSTGADTWREGVMRVYKEMKAKKPSTRFGDALKEASRRKKAGNL